MGKYLFFDIDSTFFSKKTIKEIKQTCKNSHKAFKCTKVPISIIKDVNDIGFNDIIASTGSFGNEYILENYINQTPGIREFFNIDIFSRDTDSTRMIFNFFRYMLCKNISVNRQSTARGYTAYISRLHHNRIKHTHFFF